MFGAVMVAMPAADAARTPLQESANARHAERRGGLEKRLRMRLAMDWVRAYHDGIEQMRDTRAGEMLPRQRARCRNRRKADVSQSVEYRGRAGIQGHLTRTLRAKLGTVSRVRSGSNPNPEMPPKFLVPHLLRRGDQADVRRLIHRNASVPARPIMAAR